MTVPACPDLQHGHVPARMPCLGAHNSVPICVFVLCALLTVCLQSGPLHKIRAHCLHPGLAELKQCQRTEHEWLEIAHWALNVSYTHTHKRTHAHTHKHKHTHHTHTEQGLWGMQRYVASYKVAYLMCVASMLMTSFVSLLCPQQAMTEREVNASMPPTDDMLGLCKSMVAINKQVYLRPAARAASGMCAPPPPSHPPASAARPADSGAHSVDGPPHSAPAAASKPPATPRAPRAAVPRWPSPGLPPAVRPARSADTPSLLSDDRSDSKRPNPANAQDRVWQHLYARAPKKSRASEEAARASDAGRPRSPDAARAAALAAVVAAEAARQAVHAVAAGVGARCAVPAVSDTSSGLRRARAHGEATAARPANRTCSLASWRTLSLSQSANSLLGRTDEDSRLRDMLTMIDQHERWMEEAKQEARPPGEYFARTLRCSSVTAAAHSHTRSSQQLLTTL